MRHIALIAIFSLFSLPAAASTDDYDLAALLVQRGWFDLAEDLFQRIKSDTNLSKEDRSEAEYGLARINLVRAENVRDPQKKVDECDKAIEAIDKFIKANSRHPKRAEALADIGDLRQLKGKTLVQLAKTDPDALDLAEAEFDKAEAIFEEQIKELKVKKVSPPDSEDRTKSPEKYKRDLEKWDNHERAMMFAKYNKGIAIFNRAETYRENPEKHKVMKQKLEDMNKLFGEFMWDYSTYFLAYDAAIYMGRASMILAKYADRAKAERYWANCFRYIGTSKSPLRDPEARRSEMIRDLGTRGYYYEVKARMEYGNTKKGRAAIKEFLEATKLAEELFGLIPSAKKTDMGKAVRLEQAKAYCRAGKTKEGIALLIQLKNNNKDSWVENMAIDILGEYAGETDLNLAIESADNIFDRGESWLYRALPKYRSALLAVKNEAEKKQHYPYCWYQIGRCYYWTGRYQEAALAFGKVVFDGSPHMEHEIAGDAARMKLQTLKRLVFSTGNSEDKAELDRYRSFVTARFPNVVGEGELAGRAIDLENEKKYLESNALWQKLAKQGNPYHEEALFSIGQNYYKYALQKSKETPSEADKYFEKAIRQFKEHLAFVKNLPKRTKGITRNAIGSILFSCRIHGDERFSKGNPGEALKISDQIETKFPKSDPKLLIAIMTARLNAKLRLAEMGYWYCPTCTKAVKPGRARECPSCKKASLASYLKEAEKDMEVLERNYLDIGLGRKDYLRALALLAATFEESASKLAGIEPKLAKELTLKAIEYYVKYTEEEPDALQGKKMLYMAEKLFAAAEGLREQGTDKAHEKAAEYFEKAGDLLKTYIANEGDLSKEDPTQARQIR